MIAGVLCAWRNSPPCTWCWPYLIHQWHPCWPARPHGAEPTGLGHYVEWSD